MPNNRQQQPERDDRRLGGNVRTAADAIRNRGRSIDAQLDEMMGVAPRVKKKPRQPQQDPQEMADGGRVRGPGGPTEDKVGPVMLSDTEYVLPADTADVIGRDNLDAIRAATHTFAGEVGGGLSEIPALANGGSPGEEDPLSRRLGRQLGEGAASLATGVAREAVGHTKNLVYPAANALQGAVEGLTGVDFGSGRRPPAAKSGGASSSPPTRAQQPPGRPPASIARPAAPRPASGDLMGVTLRYGAPPTPSRPNSAAAVADSLAGVEATARNAKPVDGLEGIQYAGNYGRTPTFRSTGSAGEPSFTDLRGLAAQGRVTGDAADIAAASERLADANPQRTAQNIVPAGSLAGVPGPLSDAVAKARQEALRRGDTKAAGRSLMTSAERDAMDRTSAAYDADPVEAYKTDTLASVQASDLATKQARQAFEDDRQAARDFRAEATERRRAVAARESGVSDAVKMAESLGGDDFELGQFAASLVPYLAEQAGDVPPSNLARLALEQAMAYRQRGKTRLEDVLVPADGG